MKYRIKTSKALGIKGTNFMQFPCREQGRNNENSVFPMISALIHNTDI